eukprot:CAMPEP_0171059702 /NCGR_PEP_ID=MMETSP0766_2-20121228/3358_1 /TAXON_ID=439317 /ORGANISM="Gambierdiscus australes, Strain CAWD 149" /LENGTH=178 /DNA_ID=CAMNT_0011515181 /DNA_START=360 /DNA_END=893 /DNA_ORIENTATION=+
MTVQLRGFASRLCQPFARRRPVHSNVREVASLRTEDPHHVEPAPLLLLLPLALAKRSPQDSCLDVAMRPPHFRLAGRVERSEVVDEPVRRLLLESQLLVGAPPHERQEASPARALLCKATALLVSERQLAELPASVQSPSSTKESADENGRCHERSLASEQGPFLERSDLTGEVAFED